jgi:hypothetical protein
MDLLGVSLNIASRCPVIRLSKNLLWIESTLFKVLFTTSAVAIGFWASGLTLRRAGPENMAFIAQLRMPTKNEFAVGCIQRILTEA